MHLGSRVAGTCAPAVWLCPEEAALPSTLGAGPPASPTAAPSLRPEGLQSSSHTQPLPGHAHQLWLDTGWRKRERAWWDPRPGRSVLHGATTLRRETQREKA